MLPLRQLFKSRRQQKPAPAPAPVAITVAGRNVTVALKHHATARRMVLRMARDGQGFTLTMPKRQGRAAALAFIDASRLWMENTIARSGAAPADQEISTVMLRGVPHAVQPTGKTRGLVSRDAALSILHVPGEGPHRKRKLVEWMKREAEQDLREASTRYATAMQANFTKLTVRDQKSRWGSCSVDGGLSYSWRLVMAPGFVLDYVAAHEVAHLLEMNHGPRFWRLVLTHCKGTKQAKTWLKVHGHTLHHGL